MDCPLRFERMASAPVPDLFWAGLLTFVLVFTAGALLQTGLLMHLIATIVFGGMAGLLIYHWPGAREFGWANRATLLRAALVILLISLAPFAESLGGWLWLYAVLCLLALILDGVDGSIARKTGSQSEFGARFDMELDALFILGLCVTVIALNKAGLWVLSLGLMRYGFLIAGHALPFLNRPLPDSFRRKTVCVWQVATLMIAILPVTSPHFATWTLATALILLVYSFATDVYWLYQRKEGI
ncbi:CDP-alcohol phosphatidyltransferase family protein [Marinobacter sp.]|uniref:CDP-alcohol phosphatidyltransferase family protein n=1 Tax=Marinobacter sp. TaxID=50741 RepID=UPI0034A2C364